MPGLLAMPREGLPAQPSIRFPLENFLQSAGNPQGLRQRGGRRGCSLDFSAEPGHCRERGRRIMLRVWSRKSPISPDAAPGARRALGRASPDNDEALLHMRQCRQLGGDDAEQ